MEKYGRVLVIIFFLILINLGLTFYILSKLNKPIVEKTVPVIIQKTATPSALPVAKGAEASIQSDLNLIKAEIRALRDSLESNGLILTTPEP